MAQTRALATAKKEHMDVNRKVRSLSQVSEEQLWGSEAASQVKLDLEGSEVFA